MATILCIGSASKDVFYPTSEGIILETPEDLLAQRKIAFELGAKYHVENRYESLGGCSVNVAVGLARTGEKVSCYASIGDDSIGSWMQEKMKQEGIGLETVRVQSQCVSDLSFILVDGNSGERTIFSNQVSNKLLDVEGDRLAGFNWIFIGDLSGDWQKNMDKIFQAAKENGISVAYNPRQKTIHEDVARVIDGVRQSEIVFLNKDEAIEIVSALAGVDNSRLEEESYLLSQLQQLGPKVVVVTDGSRGAWAAGEKMMHAQPILQKAVDTTGAGDAFTSGFFSAYVKEKTLMDCLGWGIVNSSSSVLYYGGQEGLLTEESIETKVSEVKTKELQ